MSDSSDWDDEAVPKNGFLHKRLAVLRKRGDDEYLAKDLLKAVGATSFIGEGGVDSSTARYREAAGDLANVGSYTSSDRVFVSANGDREGRVPVVGEGGDVVGAYANLSKVVSAGACVVADTTKYRDDPYNVGERELAVWLEKNGYFEPHAGSGYWIPQSASVWWEECLTEPTISPATRKPMNNGTRFYYCPATEVAQWSLPEEAYGEPIVVRDPSLPRRPIPPPIGHKEHDEFPNAMDHLTR
jgi:hypothetical protein